jgi:hypothetical protein
LCQYLDRGLSPSLKTAVDISLNNLSKLLISATEVGDPEVGFSNSDHRFFSKDHQSLVYMLMKVHVFSITQRAKSCLLTLEHLLEVERDLGMEDSGPIDAMRELVVNPSSFGAVFRRRVGYEMTIHH